MNHCKMNTFFKHYNARTGGIGKTAQFWIMYLDHIWLFLWLYEAVKRNDFLLYAHCIHLMPDLFFLFNGKNYARYMTMFSIMHANIEETNPSATEMLKQGAFILAHSFIPSSRVDVDKTMEETFMKHAKFHGGANGADGLEQCMRDQSILAQHIHLQVSLKITRKSKNLPNVNI